MSDTYRIKIIGGQVWAEESYVNYLEGALRDARAEAKVALAKVECKNQEIARLMSLLVDGERRPKIAIETPTPEEVPASTSQSPNA